MRDRFTIEESYTVSAVFDNEEIKKQSNYQGKRLRRDYLRHQVVL